MTPVLLLSSKRSFKDVYSRFKSPSIIPCILCVFMCILYLSTINVSIVSAVVPRTLDMVLNPGTIVNTERDVILLKAQLKAPSPCATWPKPDEIVGV